MTKNILIFSDGTGQIGGQKPDQKLSNIYKMYRAMRPGPDSPISPFEQAAYYDPGLGVGEIGGLTFKRIRQGLASAVGTGIDENVIDCYEKILVFYEPGDRVLLFGFSRGAYTVRALANVMNLCGVPTKMPDGSPVPRYGKKLRMVASEAVLDVYNHGAGHKRGDKRLYKEREEKGKRFRARYGSAPPEGDADVQGNVQPHFIGVFDTVAALGNSLVAWLVRGAFGLSILLTALSWYLSWPILITLILGGFSTLVGIWWARILAKSVKTFQPDPDKPLKWRNPFYWWKLFKNSHYSTWKKKHYDKWLDSDVGFARHALAIDEHRKNFPRVKWASQSEMDKNKGKNPEWLKQVWFAGCHSDIGGSYAEDEARLSDIALEWMIKELHECVPSIQVRDTLFTYPDPLGLQHKQTYIPGLEWLKIKWPVQVRYVDPQFALHPSVITRLDAEKVPQVDEVKPYRPEQLSKHPKTAEYYKS